MALTIVSMFLVSCSGGIEPADPAIEYTTHESGEYALEKTEDVPLNGCFEVQSVSAVVVPGKKFSSIQSQINVTIAVKLTKDLPDKVDDCSARFSLLNSDGAELAERYLSGELRGKHAGDVVSFTGHTNEDSNDNVKEMFSQIKYIRLVNFSAWKIVGKNDIFDDEDSDDFSDEELDTSDFGSVEFDENSEDWDALLSSYEQYVDKYISYVKKAAKGDVSALSEYPALMEKSQEFSSKIGGAKGAMSASQWARYMEITNKMTQAAANMQ